MKDFFLNVFATPSPRWPLYRPSSNSPCHPSIDREEHIMKIPRLAWRPLSPGLIVERVTITRTYDEKDSQLTREGKAIAKTHRTKEKPLPGDHHHQSSQEHSDINWSPPILWNFFFLWIRWYHLNRTEARYINKNVIETNTITTWSLFLRLQSSSLNPSSGSYLQHSLVSNSRIKHDGSFCMVRPAPSS